MPAILKNIDLDEEIPFEFLVGGTENIRFHEEDEEDLSKYLYTEE